MSTAALTSLNQQFAILSSYLLTLANAVLAQFVNGNTLTPSGQILVNESSYLIKQVTILLDYLLTLANAVLAQFVNGNTLTSPGQTLASNLAGVLQNTVAVMNNILTYILTGS